MDMMDTENASDEDLDIGTSVASRVMNALLEPLRPLVSKNAQKAYLGTFLFFITSLCMVFVSIIAYGIFYYKFIPQVGLERTVHLQFGDAYPWGTASLDPGLISLQQYDVQIELDLPRTPSNLAAGNFMLDLTLLSHPLIPTQPNANTTTLPISHSRRPAILTYSSTLIDVCRKISSMPLHILGLRREAERLVVQMMEKVEFARGRQNIPASLRLEVHSREEMQIYEAKVAFRTRFTGLRWLMYRWKITSFFVFSFMFWTISMVSTSLVWILLAFIFNSRTELPVGTIKKEDRSATPIKKEPGEEPSSYHESSSTDGDSDSPGDQAPSPGIKKENDYEADDELDRLLSRDAGPSEPSGVGTGLERAGVSCIQRRRSYLPKDEPHS